MTGTPPPPLPTTPPHPFPPFPSRLRTAVAMDISGEQWEGNGTEQSGRGTRDTGSATGSAGTAQGVSVRKRAGLASTVQTRAHTHASTAAARPTQSDHTTKPTQRPIAIGARTNHIAAQHATPLAALLAIVLSLLTATTAHAQLPFLNRERPATVIENIRIVNADGNLGEPTTIKIVDGRVTEVGPDIAVGQRDTRFDATGYVATPGLVDLDSSLGLIAPGRASGDATHRAHENFDRYDADAIRSALRNGVTVICVAPRGSPGVLGTASVLRLAPGDGRSAGQVIAEDAALCVNLASEGSPLVRLRASDSVVSAFRSALDYRESLEIYEQELEEYAEKLEEYLKKKAEEDKKSDAATPAPTPQTPARQGARPAGTGGSTPARTAPNTIAKNDLADDSFTDPNEEASPETDAPDTDFQQPPQRPARGGPARPPAGGPGQPAGRGGQAEPKDDSPTKPNQPQPNPQAEVLLRAIDGQLPVRFYAERSADILAAVRIVERFGLSGVIVGGAEAHLVANELARVNMTVILTDWPGPGVGPSGRDAGPTARSSPAAPAILSEAGVRWFVASGSQNADAGRFILPQAQRVVGRAGSHRDPLRLVTEEASAYLAAGRARIGGPRRGLPADIVLWSGDPRSPESRVARVYVEGRLLFADETAKPTTQQGGAQ